MKKKLIERKNLLEEKYILVNLIERCYRRYVIFKCFFGDKV